ncbi:MAG: ChaB family protein [Nesterenkonia sp.]|uniref:ChaB family protein n=1 Tax=Nesterenkonia marinintestina TaxID=2979865 RepID=UPI0021BEA6A9|nr:ChaB family protein [Nesterenkonia sp. GX14115]MDO5492187.1 ChaB family protein [Nesterenkonia sp.]
MPKTTAQGRPKPGELPDTLRRSEEKAQRTFTKAYDSAMDRYGDEERARRVAYDALKHTFEKVGDRWLPKERRGTPDPRGDEGVDAGATKEHLYRRARRLGIAGRSTMTKPQLVEALERESRRRT